MAAHEIRCPVHGLITLDEWEMDVISQPAFQRLRRIRQLGWTDLVYPGTLHSRFEHSIGVMHTVSRLYDAVRARSQDLLEDRQGYNQDGLNRDRVLVRFAALLHDVGHGPFSHAAEDLLPLKGHPGERFRHENYSAAIVRKYFNDVINNHPKNSNYGISADDVAAFLEGSSKTGGALFWRELISSQMDADRMDYLLRDSLHAGVQYGRFDLERIVNTVQAVPYEDGLRLGVDGGGLHAAEGLILARYFMFTQVYFHKTRVAYDHHLRNTLRELMPDGHFPLPDPDRLEEFLGWDDWKVLGMLREGLGGKHGERLRTRSHYREIWHTPETPKPDELKKLEQVKETLHPITYFEEVSEKSWYKPGPGDIPVAHDLVKGEVQPLSVASGVVSALRPIFQTRLYVSPEDRETARHKLDESQEAA